MASKVPGLLDALAARLLTVPGVATVYRALEGAPIPETDNGDLPAIYLRLIADTVEAVQQDKAKVAIQLALELFFAPDEDTPIDNQAADWGWALRAALAIEDPRALSVALRLDPATGIELQGASYHYPQQPGETASVRQPLVLRLIENY